MCKTSHTNSVCAMIRGMLGHAPSMAGMRHNNQFACIYPIRWLDRRQLAAQQGILPVRAVIVVVLAFVIAATGP